MSTNGQINSDNAARDLDEARAWLAAEAKIDILTGTQEADNELARREVSRSFVCECRPYMFDNDVTDWSNNQADTITGMFSPNA